MDREDERAWPNHPRCAGRWTICAMLFVATTINYVDRQVLSILKPVLSGSVLHLQPLLPGWPTVESSIHLTDVEYGNILACFQVAYALGVVFAGRLVDRLGCRRGYPIVTGLVEPGGDGARAGAARSSALAWRASFWDWVRAGIFPPRSRRRRSGFRPKERALATGIFNSGASVGAILAPLAVPWVALHFGWRASFLVTGIFSAVWIVWWSIRYRTPQQSMEAERAAEHAGMALRWLAVVDSCCAIGRRGDSCSASFSPIRCGGSFFSGCRSISTRGFSLDLSHLGPPLVVVYVSLDGWQRLRRMAAAGIYADWA